ncbi:MAG: PDZ domain-containing protein [Planctomycetes bacterium]|nr:PDZ domain-containing protein [Planctomycetota bacterium]
MLLFALFCCASFQSAPLPPATAVTAPHARVARSQEGQVDVQPTGRPGRLGVSLGAAEHGVGIEAVEPGSPAERADLRVGDRIVVVDGRQTLDFDAVVAAVRAKGAGKPLALIVERDLAIEVQELPSEDGTPRPRLGVLLAEGLGELRVSDVESDTPAERAGVRAGDRLLALDGTPTPSANALRAKVATLGAGQKVELTIARELRTKLGEQNGPGAPAAPRGGADAQPRFDDQPPRAPTAPRIVEGHPVAPEGLAAPESSIAPQAPGAPRAPGARGAPGAPRVMAEERARERAEAPGEPRTRTPRRADVPPGRRGTAERGEAGEPRQPARPALDTRELTAAMRELRAELAELRRELGELRRDLDERR